MFFKKKKPKKQVTVEKSIETWVANTKKSEAQFSKMVDNNLKGKELEKAGNVEKAKKLYEENISKNFEGNHPYDRLAIIYRKEKDYDSEIRVLNHAINVFVELSKSSPRADISPKLSKFKERLKKVEELKLKSTL